jgi:hypothetical protein
MRYRRRTRDVQTPEYRNRKQTETNQTPHPNFALCFETFDHQPPGQHDAKASLAELSSELNRRQRTTGYFTALRNPQTSTYCGQYHQQPPRPGHITDAALTTCKQELHP